MIQIRLKEAQAGQVARFVELAYCLGGQQGDPTDRRQVSKLSSPTGMKLTQTPSLLLRIRLILCGHSPKPYRSVTPSARRGKARAE